MKLAEIIIAISIITATLAGLCGLAQYSAHADKHMRIEMQRQRSLAQCDAVGFGHYYRTKDGLVWCSL